MFLIQTFAIEDCIDYQEMTSNAKQSRWTIPSAVSSSSIYGFSSNGWKMGNASSYSNIKLNTLLSLGVSIEYELTDVNNSNNPSPIIRLKDSNQSSDLHHPFFAGQSVNDSFCGESLNHVTTSGHTLKFELDTTTQKYYVDNTLIATKSKTYPNEVTFYFDTGANRICQIKNFKIKPL